MHLLGRVQHGEYIQDDFAGEDEAELEAGLGVDSDAETRSESSGPTPQSPTAGEDVEQDNGPDWMFEEGETAVQDHNYVFCPSQHRRGALCLLTKHFCQHPLLPDQTGTHSAKEIQETAVREMYLYCRQRSLQELWAYMYTSWYQPSQWVLWARSASPRLFRFRTTMACENFFKQLKHHFLHHVHRARLDHLIYIIVVNLIPSYMQRADLLDDTFCLGRARTLTPRQK